MPADETPRQKKHASKPESSLSTAVKSNMSMWTSSRSFSCRCPVALRPIENAFYIRIQQAFTQNALADHSRRPEKKSLHELNITARNTYNKI